jgi:hypothetical protein
VSSFVVIANHQMQNGCPEDPIHSRSLSLTILVWLAKRDAECSLNAFIPLYILYELTKIGFHVMHD